MAEKPPEEGYISVVDDEPEIFELLKWDTPHTQKPAHDHQQINHIAAPEQKSTSSNNPPSKQLESDLFDPSEPAFLEKYRLTKDLVRGLVEELKPVMPDSIKSIEFSVECKLLAALCFYATGKYQKTLNKSDPNTTLYFASTAVSQITEAMNHPTIVKKYIHFPHLRQERDVIKNTFYMKYGIPNVLGCIDCTHVPIARPDNDQKSHFNKSYHSKKVQIICDSEHNILSVDATNGGALSHDAALDRHVLRIDLQSLKQTGEPCWLIGGPHYTQKPYLMAPFPKITKKSPVSPEKHYTTLHTQTHSVITETIKQLKSRWKCLQATCQKQFDPTSVSQMIVACCVLHNICNRKGLPIVPMTQTEERLEAMKQKVANTPISRKQAEDTAGTQSRAKLVERLWNEKSNTPEVSNRKRSRKDRILESQNQSQIQQQVLTAHHSQLHTMQPPHLNNHLQDDPSKRARIVMNTPTYTLGVAPGWGHYPHH